MSAIIFVIKNGLRWRDAPRTYGPHKTIYNRFIRWSRMGVFNRIFVELAGKAGEPDRIMIDAVDSQALTALLFAFLLCITPFNALNNTVAQQLAPPALRSRISAQMILAISVLGFALAPALVGWLSEYVFGETHLATAMRLVMCGASALNLALLLLVWKPFLDFVQRS